MVYNDTQFGELNRRLRQQLQNAFAKAQVKTASVLFPDTCMIRPASGTYTTNDAGIPVYTTPVYREYNGLTTIPCRGDDVRSYRPDAVSDQPSQVDEVDLQLPFDFYVLETDIVEYKNFVYKIHKLADDTDFAVTKVAKLMRLGASLDSN